MRTGSIDSQPPLGPERSGVDLAGPPSNNLPAGAGTRQPCPRRGDRAGNRPRDDRRSSYSEEVVSKVRLARDPAGGTFGRDYGTVSAVKVRHAGVLSSILAAFHWFVSQT
jgi:hypothetical protein